MEIALGIAAALAVLGAVACAILVGQRNRARQRADELQTANHTLSTQVAVLETTHANTEKQIAAFKDQVDHHLKAVAGEALKESRKEFLEQAELKLKPVHAILEKYGASLSEIEKGRKESYGALRQQVQAMSEGQKQLQQETANLVTALRRPEVRGRWGEVQLRRVAELAGMIDRCDFTEQVSTTGSEGQALRPDMTVNLPNDRTIVVDAKTPLDAYIDAIEAADAATRQRHLERHADQVETKVKQLAAKSYHQQFDHSPDFVVLFIPGEAFLQAAAQARPKLIENAMEKGVVIATPSTLIALLHAVAAGWREERLAANAHKISQLGAEIHERLCIFAAHLQNLRKAIGKTVEHHDKAIGSLDQMVMPAVRKLEDLHAQSTKQWPEALEELRQTPRLSRSIQQELPPTLRAESQVPGPDRDA